MERIGYKSSMEIGMRNNSILMVKHDLYVVRA